jgi:hypothetical protein
MFRREIDFFFFGTAIAVFLHRDAALLAPLGQAAKAGYVLRFLPERKTGDI